MAKQRKPVRTRVKRDARGRFVSKADAKAQSKLRQQAKAEARHKPKSRKPYKRKPLFHADALAGRLPKPGSKAAVQRSEWQSEVLGEGLFPKPDIFRLVEDPTGVEAPFRLSVTRYQGLEATELVDQHLQNLALASVATGETYKVQVIVHAIDSKGRLVATYSTKRANPLDVRNKYLPELMDVQYVQDSLEDHDVAFDVVVTTQHRGLDDYTRGLGTGDDSTERLSGKKRKSGQRRKPARRGTSGTRGSAKTHARKGKARKVSPVKGKRAKPTSKRSSKPSRRNSRNRPKRT